MARKEGCRISVGTDSHGVSQLRLVPEHKFPQWESAWQEALVELDLKKLHDKIVVAEDAIFTRLQELSDNSDHHEERTALGDAISGLRTLKIELLKFPDWKSR